MNILNVRHDNIIKKRTTLTNAIIRILSDDEKRNEIGSRAKELVDCKFNLNQTISRIEGVYNNLLNRKEF